MLHAARFTKPHLHFTSLLLAGGMRANILRSYRELLTLLKRLPGDSQLTAGKEAKARILTHRDETDSLKVTELHKQLVAKISFLRMTTTRRPGEKSRQASGTFILREGDLVETDSAREQRWGQAVICSWHQMQCLVLSRAICCCRAGVQVGMDEFKQRHHQLLRRQHFGREPPSSKNKLF